MMDMIAGAFGTLKTASEITQGLLALKTDAAVSSKAVELNRVIFEVQHQLFTAQTDYAAVLTRVGELEAQITQLESWETEKQRYQLHELAPASLVYRIKSDMKLDGEPQHDICPNCYEKGQKAILQFSGIEELHPKLSCPICQMTIRGKRIPQKDVIKVINGSSDLVLF